MTENTQPAVVVLVGLPGSGKSFARDQAVATGDAAKSFQYSTDDRITELAGANGQTYTEGFEEFAKQANAEMDAELRSAIKEKQGVIWDQTNMGKSKRAKILRKFKDDYRTECICILPPFTADQQLELERRLANRPGKTIPDFVMRNMLNSFTLPTVSEGFDRVLYFDIYGNMMSDLQAQAIHPQSTI